MASLTDIIQQRVIQKKYETLPEWLRWVLFLPLATAISLAASALAGAAFLIVSDVPYYLGGASVLIQTCISIPFIYIILNCIFNCFYYFPPQHKNYSLLVVASFVLAFFVYDIFILTQDGFFPLFDKDPLMSVSVTLAKLLPPIIKILIAFYILRKMLSPRKRLVDIGTNLNREEDFKRSLLY